MGYKITITQLLLLFFQLFNGYGCKESFKKLSATLFSPANQLTNLPFIFVLEHQTRAVELQDVGLITPLEQPLAQRIDDIASVFFHLQHEEMIIPTHNVNSRLEIWRRFGIDLIPYLLERHGFCQAVEFLRAEESHKGIFWGDRDWPDVGFNNSLEVEMFVGKGVGVAVFAAKLLPF